MSGVATLRYSDVVRLAVPNRCRSSRVARQQLERVGGGDETGGVGDGAVVQLLPEADPVRLAGQHLPVGEVETLNIAKNTRVILETICWCSRKAPIYLLKICKSKLLLNF